MKIRKALGAFTALALLAVAALPFSASAAENAVNIIGVDGQIVNNMEETEANCAFELKDGALTVTVGSENSIGQAECYF